MIQWNGMFINWFIKKFQPQANKMAQRVKADC